MGIMHVNDPKEITVSDSVLQMICKKSICIEIVRYAFQKRYIFSFIGGVAKKPIFSFKNIG